MITIPQIRAARALLGWNQDKLADAAKIHTVTLRNIERGARRATRRTLGKIEDAFAVAGIGLFGRTGVSLKDAPETMEFHCLHNVETMPGDH